MNQLENFITMLKAAKINHDAQDYLEEEGRLTDVTIYSSNNPEGPYCDWVFSENGELMKVKFKKKKAFA